MSTLTLILTGAAFLYMVATDHEKDYGCGFPIIVVATGIAVAAIFNALGW